MKKAWTLLLTLTLLLSLAACLPEAEPPATEPPEAHTHSYIGEVTKTPTCTTDGEHTFTCACGDSFAAPVKKTAHTYTEAVTAPTCTKKGYTTYTCVCGDSYTDSEVPATDHSWGDWITAAKPTVLTEGEAARICAACGEEETQPLDKLTHSEGLKFTPGSDGTYYTVTGEGSCSDTCIGIPSVYDSKPVTQIGSYAFYSCGDLTVIIIPDSVTSIGDDAFAGCDSLTDIRIGNGVKHIGSDAFYYCSSLTSITYNGTVEQWNAIEKGEYWNSSTGDYTVRCTDGTISKADS